MLTAQERVEAGMAFLDKGFPDHVQRFNPAAFDIMAKRIGDDYGLCALQQATRDFWWEGACKTAGLDVLGEEVIQLGFYPQYRQVSISPQEFDADTDALNQAWSEAYARRQESMITLTQLAHSLGTDEVTLARFAPDDTPGAAPWLLSAEQEQTIREAWQQAPGLD